MKFIEWNDTFNIGVDILDKDHQYLVSLVNNSYNSLQLNNTEDASLIIYELIDYIKYHLSTEERLMQEHNYPLIDEHEIAHANFCIRLQEFRSKLNENDALIDFQLVVSLKDWLMDHILINDRELAIYLISKG